MKQKKNNNSAVKELQALFDNILSKNNNYSLYDLNRDIQNYPDDEVIRFAIWGIQQYNQYSDLYYASFFIRLFALKKATEQLPVIKQFYDRFCHAKRNPFTDHILLSIEILENLLSNEKCLCRILADHKVPPEYWQDIEIVFSYKINYPPGAPDAFMDQVLCKKCGNKWEIESIDSSASGKQIIWRKVMTWEFEFSDLENILSRLQSEEWNERVKGSLLDRTARAIMDKELTYDKAFRDYAVHKGGYALIVPYILYDYDWFFKNIRLILKDSMVPGFRTLGFSLYLNRLPGEKLKELPKGITSKTGILGKNFVDELLDIIDSELQSRLF